jgi:hypothetical protein
MNSEKVDPMIHLPKFTRKCTYITQPPVNFKWYFQKKKLSYSSFVLLSKASYNNHRGYKEAVYYSLHPIKECNFSSFRTD